MAQAMLENKKIKKNVSTQTGTSNEFYVNLSPNKHVKLYFSESYKDIVLSFNINQCKSFIITRQMWKILRAYINKIDLEFTKPTKNKPSKDEESSSSTSSSSGGSTSCAE